MTLQPLLREIDKEFSFVSFPMVDVGALPLRLPYPDSLNTGGHLTPTPQGTIYSYSNLDLLIAGIEAVNRGIIITDLPTFFDTSRQQPLMTLHKINIVIKDYSIRILTIAELKDLAKLDTRILQVCRHNAPLTFKWV